MEYSIDQIKQIVSKQETHIEFVREMLDYCARFNCPNKIRSIYYIYKSLNMKNELVNMGDFLDKCISKAQELLIDIENNTVNIQDSDYCERLKKELDIFLKNNNIIIEYKNEEKEIIIEELESHNIDYICDKLF